VIFDGPPALEAARFVEVEIEAVIPAGAEVYGVPNRSRGSREGVQFRLGQEVVLARQRGLHRETVRARQGDPIRRPGTDGLSGVLNIDRYLHTTAVAAVEPAYSRAVPTISGFLGWSSGGTVALDDLRLARH
jgi:hypothetical protein